MHSFGYTYKGLITLSGRQVDVWTSEGCWRGRVSTINSVVTVEHGARAENSRERKDLRCPIKQSRISIFSLANGQYSVIAVGNKRGWAKTMVMISLKAWNKGHWTRLPTVSDLIVQFRLSFQIFVYLFGVVLCAVCLCARPYSLVHMEAV